MGGGRRGGAGVRIRGAAQRGVGTLMCEDCAGTGLCELPGKLYQYRYPILSYRTVYYSILECAGSVNFRGPRS